MRIRSDEPSYSPGFDQHILATDRDVSLNILLLVQKSWVNAPVKVGSSFHLKRQVYIIYNIYIYFPRGNTVTVDPLMAQIAPGVVARHVPGCGVAAFATRAFATKDVVCLGRNLLHARWEPKKHGFEVGATP